MGFVFGFGFGLLITLLVFGIVLCGVDFVLSVLEFGC